jgi:4-hydroxybenzoate polyprenyltransferase
VKSLTLPSAPASPWGKLTTFAGDIKISHTVFALPWALMSMVLAGKGHLHGGQVALIVLCMATARTVAMTANRNFDARIDAGNPRTARRAIPSGALSSTFMWSAFAACGLAFIGATALFGTFFQNWLPLILSVPVLAFISSYPFLKRFSAFCHYYLGAALALAPVCAWVAIAGTLAAPPLWMFATVLLWTAGFDIIYACQDYEFDVKNGLFSVPARLGIPGALWAARLTHLICLGCLIALRLTTPEFGVLFSIACLIAGLLLLIEHSLVKANDLSKLGLAFFTINGIISVMIGTLGIVDVFV